METLIDKPDKIETNKSSLAYLLGLGALIYLNASAFNIILFLILKSLLFNLDLTGEQLAWSIQSLKLLSFIFLLFTGYKLTLWFGNKKLPFQTILWIFVGLLLFSQLCQFGFTFQFPEVITGLNTNSGEKYYHFLNEVDVYGIMIVGFELLKYLSTALLFHWLGKKDVIEN